jgi:hypothetical protein
MIQTKTQAALKLRGGGAEGAAPSTAAFPELETKGVSSEGLAGRRGGKGLEEPHAVDGTSASSSTHLPRPQSHSAGQSAVKPFFLTRSTPSSLASSPPSGPSTT